MSYGQQTNRGQTEQYGPFGGGGLRTRAQGSIADYLFDLGEQGPAGQYANRGGGLYQQLFGRATGDEVPYRPPNIVGGVENAFRTAINQGMSKFSSAYANRGFNRPENINAILGSTIQNVAPQFAPYYAEQARAEAQVPLIQEDIRRKRIEDFLNALGLGGTLLGGQSYSTQRAGGFNVGYGGDIPESASTAAIAAICWIAGVLYGEGSLQQQTIREWLLERAKHSLFWKLFVAVYRRYGQQIATWIEPRTWAKRIMRRPFDWILRKALTHATAS